MVEFLLAGDRRAAAGAASLTETGAWSEALALAPAWKITPQLFARIQALEIQLTAADTATLRREFLRGYAQSAARASKAIAAILVLQQAGIRVAAFKGFASMAVLYGDAKHRTIGDADLMILREDLMKALTCLEHRNITRRGRETLEQHLRFVDHSPRFAGNKAITLFVEDGTEIDLHWELAGSGLETREILDRARAVSFMGAHVPVVDAADGFLLTVHHAIREDLGIESICRDLLDAALWCRRLQQDRQLEAALKRASDAGCLVPALAVTGILTSYDDSGPAARAAQILHASASPAQSRSAGLLIDLFHYQMGNGRMGKDVQYLVHSRPWRQILKGLGSDWSGYRQSMESIESHVDEAMPLLGRAVLLARSIPGPRGLKLARELARVKYGALKDP
jgi:hypothetical protein